MDENSRVEELKELMIKKMIFIEDVEKSMKRKLDMSKPLDIALVLNHINYMAEKTLVS